MKTQTDTAASRQSLVLRLHKPLVEINEFARREGTTPEQVTQCGEIGIVQLRKHSGRTFVVDTPLYSYDNHIQTDDEVSELLGLTHSGPIDQTAETPEIKSLEQKNVLSKPFKAAGSKLLDAAWHVATKFKPHNKKEKTKRLNLPDIQSQKEQPSPPPILNQSIEPGSIARLVREMLQNSEQLKAHAQKIESQQTICNNPRADDHTKQKICELTEQVIKSMHTQLDEIELSASHHAPSRTPPKKDTLWSKDQTT